MSTNVKELLNNISSKEYYTVELHTDGKLSFQSSDPWPYDTFISGNNISMEILASSQEEADELGRNWILGFKRGNSEDVT
jgi:hypothetical protein